MKVISLFFCFLPCCLLAQFPSIPMDFEPSTINYTYYDFGGVVTTGSIPNPDASGENTSSQVLQLTKNAGAETWGGSAMPLEFPIDFATNGNILSLKIYAPRANVPVLLKVEDTSSPPNPDGSPSVIAQLSVSTINVNTWEVLDFDMALHPDFDVANNYNQIVLFPDFGALGQGEVFYIDDIAFDMPDPPIDEGCMDTIQLNSHVHLVDSTFHAEHVLNSGGNVSGGLQVYYYAGGEICLDPGFIVNSGNEFTADIVPCCVEKTWYQDVDADGFGNPYITMLGCEQPPGYVETPRFNVGYTTPASYPEYALVWSDEFDNNILDPANWGYDLGDGCPNVCGWGNNEIIWYQEENATVGDDFLTIEAREESAGGYSYTSSRIKTQGKQSFQYGRVDIRAKLPYSQGVWPALWMLGENITTVGWPSCGEIDVMELIGGGNNDSVTHGTGHWNNNGHNYMGGSYSLANGIFADQFHVFSIIWDANQIQWFVDDNLFYTLDITDPTRTEFHNPFFFIFNIAIGGNWPGYPDATSVFPQTMVVDYIRVFQ